MIKKVSTTLLVTYAVLSAFCPMTQAASGNWTGTGAIINTNAYIDGGLMNLTGTKSGSGNVFSSNSSGTIVVTIPEPSTWALMISGLLLIAAISLARKKRTA